MDQENRMRIGWVVPRLLPYSRVMASTRIRVYDVIKSLKKESIKTGIFLPCLKYDIVVFQKAFSAPFIKQAKKLKQRGTKIVLDINVNYIDDDGECVSSEQQENILEMIKLCDCILTSSEYLRSLYSGHHKNVVLIEEAINIDTAHLNKSHSDKKIIKLLYCGYAAKAKELELIKNVLIKLNKKYGVKLLFICEKDPALSIIPYEFVKFNTRNSPYQMLDADIKIAPRDMQRKYNFGHTFTKIGLPMSLGLPVVASPIPSYLRSPAIICETEHDWFDSLEELVRSAKRRSEIAAIGRTYVLSNFSSNVITNQYINLFKRLCL